MEAQHFFFHDDNHRGHCSLFRRVSVIYFHLSLSVPFPLFFFLYSIDTQRDVYIYDGVKERKKEGFN